MDEMKTFTAGGKTFEVVDEKARTDVQALSEEIADYATEVNELKTSVSEGKALIASAVTDKGVKTADDATFATMAANIEAIEVGVDTSNDTVTPETLAEGITAHDASGQQITGTMVANGGGDIWFEIKNNNHSGLMICGTYLAKGDSVRIIGSPNIYDNAVYIQAMFTGGGFAVLVSDSCVNGVLCSCTVNYLRTTSPMLYEFVIDVSAVELTGQDTIIIGEVT